MPIVKKKLDANQYQLKDQVVSINRVTKVVKGGKNMSFAALVVVGDPSAAVVGYGSGKAKEVPQAIRKGIEAAKKNLLRINLNQTTIPHQVLGRYGAGMVMLKPAPEGTGVIAGGAVRAVMTSAGVQNVLTKSIGTTNPHNVIKATFNALATAARPQGNRDGARQDRRGALIMARIRKKIEKKAAAAGTQDPSEVCALGDFDAGQAQAGGQGTGIHAPEPGDRAGRHAVDPGDGGEGPAPGRDRRVTAGPSTRDAPFSASSLRMTSKFCNVTRRTENGRRGTVHNESE